MGGRRLRAWQPAVVSNLRPSSGSTGRTPARHLLGGWQQRRAGIGRRTAPSCGRRRLGKRAAPTLSGPAGRGVPEARQGVAYLRLAEVRLPGAPPPSSGHPGEMPRSVRAESIGWPVTRMTARTLLL
jgi:hypothetical protein